VSSQSRRVSSGSVLLQSAAGPQETVLGISYFEEVSLHTELVLLDVISQGNEFRSIIILEERGDQEITFNYTIKSGQ
jgi:hypothetical protein